MLSLKLQKWGPWPPMSPMPQLSKPSMLATGILLCLLWRLMLLESVMAVHLGNRPAPSRTGNCRRRQVTWDAYSAVCIEDIDRA